MIAGRYTLEREIGRGGSGTVHLAHDEVLGRTVAIKRIGVMPGTDAADMQRAEREARLAASLNHPHVVAVFDLVEEDDCHWLVMEYVEGQTLSQLVRTEGPLETTAAAALLAQTADALTDAHAGGIVHRDVKPSNILVSDGVAKLSDFGIARSANDASLTQTGLVTGSPAYLAPEVASGSSATPASDVWSLGATLFHAVSGRPPYDVGGNLIGALYKIVHEEPPSLPDGHPMAGLLGVMLVRDPQQRWPMRRVRDELQRLARGQQSQVPTRPVPARGEQSPTGVLPAVRTTPVAPIPQAAERHHRRWGLIALAAVLAVAAVVSAYYLAGRGTPEAATENPGRSASADPSEDPTTRRPAPAAGDPGGDQGADGRLRDDLPRDRHERPGGSLRDADAGVPGGQRRLRGLHRLLGHGALRLTRLHREQPVGPDRGLHGQLRDEHRHGRSRRTSGCSSSSRTTGS